MTRAQRS